MRRVNPSGRQVTDQGKPGGSNSYRRSVAGDDVHELQSIPQQFPDDVPNENVVRLTATVICQANR